jgi:methionyl-tRNA formyltransferase
MRVVFAGTPEFARIALSSLHAAGFQIPLVLTQPDRPAGRGMKLQASAVKQWAQQQLIPVAQPRSLRLDGKYPEDAMAAKQAIETAGADVMVVAAYGLLLPEWVLNVMSERGEGPPRARPAPPGGSALHEVKSVGAIGRNAGPPQARPAPPGGSALHEVKSVGALKLGCLNIHASLLPRWRGAAPIHRAIEAGDKETGVTIMQMDAGLDTGGMLLIGSLPIAPAESTASLHDKLAQLGGRLIIEVLELTASGCSLSPRPQPLAGVTYASKIEKQEADIDWTGSAVSIERRIRAFNPFPVAFSSLGNEPVKLHQALALAGVATSAAAPGEVLAAGAAGVDIATADGVLRATRMQKPGGKAMDAADFLRGFEIRPGMIFRKST